MYTQVLSSFGTRKIYPPYELFNNVVILEFSGKISLDNYEI